MNYPPTAVGGIRTIGYVADVSLDESCESQSPNETRNAERLNYFGEISPRR